MNLKISFYKQRSRWNNPAAFLFIMFFVECENIYTFTIVIINKRELWKHALLNNHPITTTLRGCP